MVRQKQLHQHLRQPPPLQHLHQLLLHLQQVSIGEVGQRGWGGGFFQVFCLFVCVAKLFVFHILVDKDVTRTIRIVFSQQFMLLIALFCVWLVQDIQCLLFFSFVKILKLGSCISTLQLFGHRLLSCYFECFHFGHSPPPQPHSIAFFVPPPHPPTPTPYPPPIPLR